MFCPECGSKLEDGAKFCSECGTLIELNNSQPISPHSAPIATKQNSTNTTSLQIPTSVAVNTNDNNIVQAQSSITDTTAYRLAHGIAKYLDGYYLDPVIGFIPIAGDISPALLSLPSIYLALVHIKSIPLALAMTLNLLIDVVIGLIPFYIGNIFDFFHKAYSRNMKLADGWINGDKRVREEVKSKAIISAILIALVCLIIYWLISLIGGITETLTDWVSGWFD